MPSLMPSLMIEQSTCWPAPAKLNLFLHVTGKRPDGYHELQTIFQLLDWGDELIIEARSDGLISRTNEIPGIAAESDLSIRAAHLLQRETACRLGANIGLIKQIPAGAGLGGGSSDAATVLHVLNRLWDCGLSRSDLADLGIRLGADVPVFIHGMSAWAEGIGEMLHEVVLEESWYVLIFPGIAVSTASVFADPGLKRNSKKIRASEFSLASTRNDCESVVANRYPVLKEIFADLGQWGSPRLTGTGSCIFLPCDEKNHAISITNELNSRYTVRAVRGVNKSPLLAKLSEVN